MTQRRHKEIVRGFVALAFTAVLFLAVPHAYADTCATNQDQQTCSNNFGLSETFFGSGGVDTCPTQGGNAYCASMSAGDLTVGNTSSNNYRAQAGFDTDRTPSLEVTVTKSAVDLGVLDATTTGVDTAEFSVKSYWASGYVVQIAGSTPTYAGHSIPGMSGTGSSQGTEQFGMNLVANTSPEVMGADPEQDADAAHSGSPFGFGDYATGYGTANQYRYSSGDTVAQSTESSGYTYYTITYLMNVNNLTPAGTYIANQSIVVTSTF